ncbi:hypothetical protein MMC30_003835 [Trapelia coarctata]|nr:hypothetical protein [Trapelia coarctata]
MAANVNIVDVEASMTVGTTLAWRLAERWMLQLSLEAHANGHRSGENSKKLSYKLLEVVNSVMLATKAGLME